MIKLIKAIVLLSLLIVVGCKKTYFNTASKVPVDLSGNLNMSTVDYLKSHPETFDTLATLIKLTGLEEAVNAKGNTFFAPRDYSIHNFFKLLYPDPQKQPATLDAIPQADMDGIASVLKNYIIPNQQITRGSLATTYSYATTYGGRKARFNIITSDYLGNVNMGAKSIVFSLNVSAVSSVEIYQPVTVATADLKSTNGIVHILDSSTHIFGFN